MRTLIIAAALCILASAADRVGPPEAYPPVWVTGEVDATVTQANIHKTICVDHYTVGVRSVTEAEKKAILKRDSITAPAEIDHFISLELAGTNNPDKNLWAEPYAGKYGARRKDVIETALHRAVCRAEGNEPITLHAI